MNKIKAVFQFGGPYIAPYWRRLVIGIFMGVAFGMVNASFVWATRTMFTRLTSSKVATIVCATNIHVIVSTNGESAAVYTAPIDALTNLHNITTNTGSAFWPAIYTNDSAVVWAANSSVTNARPELFSNSISPKKVKRESSYAFVRRAKEIGKAVNARIDNSLDPWLPKHGRTLDWHQVLGGLMLLPLLIGCRGVLGYLSTYCLNWVSEKAVNDLRVNVLAKLNTLSISFFHHSKMGDLLTQINGDTSSMQRALALGVGDLVKEPMTVICVLGALFVVSFKLSIFAIIFLPICVIPIVILGKKVRRAARGSRDANISQMSLLVEALSGIRIVKAFGLENEQLERFRKTCKDMFHHAMKSTQARGLVNPAIEVVAMFGLGVLLVYIVYSQTELPDLVAFLTGVAMLFEPIKKLAGIHVIFEQTSVGVGRLVELLNQQSTVKEPASPKRLADFRSKISFENINFAYEPQTLVLDGFKLDIHQGQKIGIAGESGSGKSTIVNLLMRFYDPTQGAIKIDGIDLRDIATEDLRNAMALVSQEIVIFDQTVAANIAFGRKGATQAEVEAAAKAAFAHEFIMAMPQGYQTVVGERGQSLSVGQRQRLSIARAFVRNAPILVLDEATASLDSRAESEVQAAIERLEQNKTVLCIAHRLSTLKDMDQIIVLARGRIIEQGGFHQLLAAEGSFAAMAQRQGLSA